MKPISKQSSIIKPKLHPRNRNLNKYDLKALVEVFPALAPFVKLNPVQEETIDFSDPEAVKTLNSAILKYYYQIENWDIPAGYLCPPIPGRADYIHHIADLLGRNNFGKIPVGEKIKVLDIGVGANCIYPIIGTIEYGWSFMGSDIDPVSIESANAIIDKNHQLTNKVDLKLQTSDKDYFYGIIKREEFTDLTICNPPFHASSEDAQEGSARKVSNLTKSKVTTSDLNFGGQHNELWCFGGESRFIKNMILQSKKFSKSVYWFSTLVSKQSNLKGIYNALEDLSATEVETIEMGQGNKSSRVVAWSFLTKEEQLEWKKSRWKTEKL